MAVQTQIQTRRGSAATWTSTNPTLAAGEIGFESDTNKFKIGTGSTAWVSLPYASNVSPLTTKGDLYTYSTDNARLAVGANGETLVADSSTSTGLRWQGDYAAGKNKIINGDFGIFQRSTSATMSADATYYAPDRWKSYFTAGSTTVTWSRQTFTPGAAPVAGYEGQYFSRISAPSSFGATGEFGMYQPIENVQTLAGQTITVSFFAKADSARTSTIFISQNFGSGGSAPVSTLTSQALTTSWVRYSLTVTLGSISGKTIGTGSALNVGLLYTAGNATGAPVMDVWGFQVEAGSVATPFQTATGTIQGELAACQRYYFRTSGTSLFTLHTWAIGTSTIQAQTFLSLPSQMRALGAVEFSNIGVFAGAGLLMAVTSATIGTTSNKQNPAIDLIGTSGLTAGTFYRVLNNNNATGYIAISGEL